MFLTLNDDCIRSAIENPGERETFFFARNGSKNLYEFKSNDDSSSLVRLILSASSNGDRKVVRPMLNLLHKIIDGTPHPSKILNDSGFAVLFTPIPGEIQDLQWIQLIIRLR